MACRRTMLPRVGMQLSGFTSFASVPHNIFPAAFPAVVRTPLKLRGWLMMLVFVHVLLHPWVHAMGMTKSASQLTTVSNGSGQSDNLVSTDQCELCRVGHSATLTPRLPKTELLNPQWVRIALHAVNYASLQADRRLPSRAPPIL